MEKEGLYNGNLETHREVLLFCFLPVIQYELNGLIIMWNRRHVRQSSVGPAGKPDILFYLPTIVGFEHQGIPIEKDDISVATEIIGITQPPAHRNKDIFDLVECYVYLNNLIVGSSVESALGVYVKLIGLLHGDEIVFKFFKTCLQRDILLKILKEFQNRYFSSQTTKPVGEW